MSGEARPESDSSKAESRGTWQINGRVYKNRTDQGQSWGGGDQVSWGQSQFGLWVQPVTL